MGGSTSTNTNQTQSSSTSPWAPAQPMLSSILGQLGSQPTTPSGASTTAANNLVSAAGEVPNEGAAATGAVNNALGLSTSPQMGILNSAYNTLQSNLAPITSASLNPMDTPGFSDALKTMNTDITNQVNSQFAAAGRDLSRGNSQALARGISQGDSSAIAGQYNANVGNLTNASNSLFSGGSTTNSGLTADQLAEITGQGAGVGEAGSLAGLYTSPASTQLAASQTQQNLPLGILQNLEGLTTPIAGLGSQSTGYSTGTQSTNQSGLSSILGGILGGVGALGQTGAFGTGATATAAATPGWLSTLGTAALGLFSDKRLKEDIKPVGMLNDGQKIYSFRYKGTATPRIGLLAQEVRKKAPGAVTTLGGRGGPMLVDYGKATANAAKIGMLHNLPASRKLDMLNAA